jgi:serine/threonine-protein kinase HipA
VPPGPAVEVFVSGRRAGTLLRSDIEEDTILFGYAEGCRDEDAVSLTMPVVADQYDSMSTVHPIFQMNLPEGALLEKLRLLFAKVVPELDDLSLLSIVGESQIGRLRYAGPNAQPGAIPSQNLDEILTYAGAQDLFSDLLNRFARYSGVSGVQPKVLVSAPDALPERITTRGATHIVKSFDPREFPELAANEYYCMRAAHHAGMPVAKATLSKNRRILVVERFDLQKDGAYCGLEDFCVLNALRSYGRYEGSYELIARRLIQFVSYAHRRESLLQLFMIVALSCAIENGDAHLKNFAVIYEHATAAAKLAPAYDLVTTTPYQPRDTLALTLAGAKTFPNRETLVTFGRQSCELMPSQIDAALEQIENGVRTSVKEIRSAIRNHPDFAKAGEHFIAAFERGLQRTLASGEKKRAARSHSRPRRAG